MPTSVDVFLYTYALSLSIDLGRSLVEAFLNFKKNNRRTYELTEKECAFIIPCHNSGKSITPTLESLSPTHTIYCVANACSDGTEEIIRSGKTTKANLLTTPVPGKLHAVMLGAFAAKEAGFSHFMLLDDDIIWPKKDGQPRPLEISCKDTPCTAFPVIPDARKKDPWLVHGQAIEYALMIVSKRAQSLLGNVIMASGAAGLFRIDAFLKAMTKHDGEHVGDDLQTSFIFHTLGFKIDFNSEAIIKTEAPSTFKDWWKQRTKRWEPSPVFNLVWHLRVIFTKQKIGWWIRAVTFYRVLIVKLDLFRLVSLPFALIYDPLLVLGILSITYLSLSAKVLTFKKFFPKINLPRLALVSYPVYGSLCWLSRAYSVPRGLRLLTKYWIFSKRKPLLLKEAKYV